MITSSKISNPNSSTSQGFQSLIEFAGHSFIPSNCGSLYWPTQDTLIVSDLHFEKGSSFVKAGRFLPPYDTLETLQKLKAACDKFQPAKLLFLGDVFHDPSGFDRMPPDEKSLFTQILNTHEILWVDGNHDDGTAPPGIEVHETLEISGIDFTHIATNTPKAEMSGHYHPCVKLKHKGQKLRRACFVVTDTRLIMPSFGAYTGGLEVSDPAIQTAVLNQAMTLYILGPKAVHKLALTQPSPKGRGLL